MLTLPLALGLIVSVCDVTDVPPHTASRSSSFDTRTPGRATR
jgi:hypothetical protein